MTGTTGGARFRVQTFFRIYRTPLALVHLFYTVRWVPNYQSQNEVGDWCRSYKESQVGDRAL